MRSVNVVGPQSNAVVCMRHWLCILAVWVLFIDPIQASAVASRFGDPNPIPVLAYYYIWFDQGSWDRAKTDYPLLGRYSSDDRAVMLQHVRWAKQVGIDGFIVSWKSTEKLNRRLEQLMTIAAEEDFKLAIIYQGLNFERRPLPIEQIATDLDHFIDHYAEHRAYDIFEKPIVIWSGTWEFTRDDVTKVAQERRQDLLILASEKNVQGYERLADTVDGNAYYWSSVNPDTFPGYQEKLDAMGQAVNNNTGLWIAPAAPGFDARLVGGTQVIERQGGQTLRKQMDAAFKSSPDVVGLISWNEFSENSHVEPSRKYGMRYLDVLADMRSGTIPEIIDIDSSEPGQTHIEPGNGRIASMGIVGALTLASFVIIMRREAQKHRKATQLGYTDEE